MLQQLQYKNNQVLSYAEYGNPQGFPIVIQHGIIASIQDFGLFKKLIENGFRIICIARPGYGYSSPYPMINIGEFGEIVLDLITKLDIQLFDVFGMSSGAPYSYSISNSMPDKIRNIYIFSGTPALYNYDIQKMWPYEINTKGTISEFQQIANSVFFSNIPSEAKEQNDIKDSMKNNCFGVALDLMIRCKNWGFDLSTIKAKVFMQHSEEDNSVPYKTALFTSTLLSNCELRKIRGDVHFSSEVLDEFIQKVIEPNS